MKKAIMLKMNRSSPDSLHSSPSPNISSSEAVHLDIQPPLPPEPPPQDDLYPLYVKQEKYDDYESSSSEVSPESSSSEVSPGGLQKPEPKNNSLNIIPEEPVMCRDFIRGTCKRPFTCKFAHTYDSTQMVGVYTFCRRYQNSVCTYPSCKYVHATVFEEHHFYRTGSLPPHTLAHHRRVNEMLALPPPPPPPLPPPPPPPPPPPIEHPSNFMVNTNLSMNHIFAYPPPSLNNEVFQETPRYVPSGRNKLKRSWSCVEPDFSSSSSDHYTNENYAIKCKHCDFMDFRVQFHEEKIKKMLLAKEELNNKMYTLDKQKEKLCSIMLAFLSALLEEQLRSLINAANRDRQSALGRVEQITV